MHYCTATLLHHYTAALLHCSTTTLLLPVLLYRYTSALRTTTLLFLDPLPLCCSQHGCTTTLSTTTLLPTGPLYHYTAAFRTTTAILLLPAPMCHYFAAANTAALLHCWVSTAAPLHCWSQHFCTATLLFLALL